MICTFCGTESPQGNRFCGMCGVRLERRKSERRTHQRGSTACPGCGHLNEPGYKFCGMCGAKIDQRTRERRASEGGPRANAVANIQLPAPEPRRTAFQREPEMAAVGASTLVATPHEDHQYAQREVPSSVSGPSFLGLNEPTGDTEYLLEEQGSSHRGLRALLLLIVLAAIVGLIFVQYRSSLKANPRSPAPPNPGPATVPRSEGRSGPLNQDKARQTAVAVRGLQSAVTLVAAAIPPLKAGDATLKQDAQTDGPQSDPAKNETAESGVDPPSAADPPSPALIKAQQYLHGHGVRQSCEQGMVYLRAAARENDPQAAVQMGALYSSGVCVARDRVKAYEWFNSAREMQPENRWISRNLDELWAHMTPQERRQIHQQN